MEDINDPLKLHVAGATVRHESPFADLPSHKNPEELSQDFIDTWAIPFYMKIGNTDESWTSQLVAIKDEITRDVVLKLLGDFNWRTRQTGAFFAAVKNFTDLTDIIGIHLLKSEVCYAGSIYAYTLASFNSAKSINYLERYLTYYLARPDLWFDQRDVMEALTYLDQVNQTNLTSKHAGNWRSFIANKPHWKKHITTDRLEEQLALMERVKNQP